MKISKKSDIQTVASIVCNCLLENGIDAVLTGGSVVSIYTDNEYESKDLDFISSADVKTIEAALKEVGFAKSSGRHFTHKETEFFVEFPTPPLAIGEMLITDWATLSSKAGKLQLLTPTHSVMDRLAGYYHWDDKQNLDQAIMIAKRHPIKIRAVEEWSKAEGQEKKFDKFIDKLKEIKRKKK